MIGQAPLALVIFVGGFGGALFLLALAAHVDEARIFPGKGKLSYAFACLLGAGTIVLLVGMIFLGLFIG